MTKRILAVLGFWVLLITPQTLPAQEQLTLQELKSIENLITTGEILPALEKLEHEIRAISSEQGRNSTELIPPLILRGDAYMELGDLQSAIESYDDARYVSRQHYGLHDLGQVEILYREAAAYYRAGDVLEANDRHEYAFSVFTRRFGTDSESILPGLFQLADWYMDTHNIITARGLYERALQLSDNRNNPEMIEYHMDALSDLARTYRLEKFRPSQPRNQRNTFQPRPYGSLNHPDQYYARLNDYVKGEEALLELVRLRVAVEEPLSIQLAEAKLELGDWYWLFGKREKAQVVYRDLWETLTDTPQSTFINDHLIEPHALYQPLPSPSVPDDDDEVVLPSEGRVEYSLSVSSEGETSNVLETYLRPSFLSSKVIKQSIENSIYRPAFVDGEPVNTDNVEFVHTFVYYPDKREAKAGTESRFGGSNSLRH